MHGQYCARLMVAFSAAENHRPFAGTKFYCLLTEAHVCEQLAQGRYINIERTGVPQPLDRNCIASILASSLRPGRLSDYCI